VIDWVLDRVVTAFDRRVSRRHLLARAAQAGSALTVAPLRYLVRPMSALATITCSDCSTGDQCCDGWTTFCCTLSGSNSCPQNTFMAGWWKCTNYTGSRLCNAQNVRYYVDCNRTPTFQCDEGCHCAKNNCGNRSTCCNWFRYGQCNTQVLGTTEVVCRMVTCTSPATLFVNCNGTYFQDDNTCSHEEGCL
jgi:hypothetical protein